VARRQFVVLRPLKVTLVNVPADYAATLSAPDFPRDAGVAGAASHALPITNTVYIEEEDFRLEDHPDYYGLAPGKVAGLRYGGYVKVVGVDTDAATGKVTGLRAEYDAERAGTLLDAGGGGGGGKKAKVKGNLHWVSGAAPGVPPPAVEVRLYEHLFTTEVPGSTGDWEAELNPHSEVILRGALAAPSLLAPGGVAPLDHFQFERVGFFVVDKDSDVAAGKLVFNLTVGLKEAAEVKKVRGGAPAGAAGK
jgi:glutaminyl-tRNA synthetase